MRLTKQKKREIIDKIIEDKFKEKENDINARSVVLTDKIYDHVYNGYHKKIMENLPDSVLTTLSCITISYHIPDMSFNAIRAFYFSSPRKVFDNLKYGVSTEELRDIYGMTNINDNFLSIHNELKNIKTERYKMFQELNDIFACINTVKQLKQWGKADKYCDFKNLEKHLPQKSLDMALHKLNDIV